MNFKEIDVVRGAMIINGFIWLSSICALPLIDQRRAVSYFAGGIVLLIFSSFYRQFSLRAKGIPEDIADAHVVLAALPAKFLFPVLWLVNIIAYAMRITSHIYFPLFCVATITFGSEMGSYHFMMKSNNKKRK